MKLKIPKYEMADVLNMMAFTGLSESDIKTMMDLGILREHYYRYNSAIFKAGEQTSNHEAIHCTMQRLEQEEKGEQSCMLLLMQRGKAKDALRCMHHRSALRWALHRTAFFIRPCSHPHPIASINR